MRATLLANSDQYFRGFPNAVEHLEISPFRELHAGRVSSDCGRGPATGDGAEWTDQRAGGEPFSFRFTATRAKRSAAVTKPSNVRFTIIRSTGIRSAVSG